MKLVNGTHQFAPDAERGASLIMVLLILVVITVLGLASAKMGILGERATRFDRDYQIAVQAAEAALMDAEFDIRGPNTSGNSRVANFSRNSKIGFEGGCGGAGSTQGLCAPSDTAKPVWASVDFLDDTTSAKSVGFGAFTGRAFDAGASGLKPARAPRYIIEALDDQSTAGGGKKMGPPGVTNVIYRITAIGFGPREETQAVLQIEFRKE